MRKLRGFSGLFAVFAEAVGWIYEGCFVKWKRIFLQYRDVFVKFLDGFIGYFQGFAGNSHAWNYCYSSSFISSLFSSFVDADFTSRSLIGQFLYFIITFREQCNMF